MNGTELRNFSHLQILTSIGYSDLSRNILRKCDTGQNLKMTKNS